MNKKERAEFVGKTLDALYPDPPIPLQFKNTFTFLVAVLLSAQCTDKKVNSVTPNLFALADTPQKMAKIPTAKIEDIIRPCGLAPAKSKHISALSQILLEKFLGEVPRTFEELESLPGVGHKTASVIMSQAYGIPAFPVDTHIHRLAMRWKLSDGSSVEKTEKDLKKLFPQEEWNRRHLQIIYFGREYCKARGHDATKCPICSQIGTSNYPFLVQAKK
ncbi:MAG: endonuclease III [Fibrobacter sp.]|nr:endonuclease III [Fibrobacter sp.]MDY6370399.1 endonuclease III [Fibrobacter sp.]MDY6391066.1 endonuclease III [Fibrobacter sp.]